MTMKQFLLPSLFFLSTSLASAQRAGKDYAVFFYVTDFQSGWAKLPETAPEAAQLKTELETNFGFSCESVMNPSKATILAKIKTYNDRLTANDQVLFFFSMHGHYEENAERGYLIASDGALNDDYGTSWLSYDDLSAYLARCKAKHVLLALDACHSGAFGIRNKARPDVPIYAQTDDCAQRVAKMLQYGGRQYCSSGNKASKTPAKSLFASRFLEALRKGGEEGIVRFDDLEFYLGKVENPRPESGTFKGHEPGGDFVFVRKNACASLPSFDLSAGKPDRDGDNVPDASDKCPDDWGSQANGCPSLPDKPSDMAADLAAWKEAKRLNTEAAYRAYLRSYPGGEFKELANAALRNAEAAAARQRDETAWSVAEEKNTPDGYKKYLADYPNGLHKADAAEKQRSLDQADSGAVMPDGMVFVKGGTFSMGSPSTEADRGSDEEQHEVEVSDFYIAQHELTVADFKKFIDATGYKTDAEKAGTSWVFTTEWKEQSGVNWKCDTKGNLRPANEYNHPVIHFSWNDAVAYCQWRSKQTSLLYRLPTEAEWEYAARGGGKTVLFGNGKNIADPKEINFNGSASYKKNYSVAGEYRAKTIPVGSLNSPNALGLHDMSGNVWEWCSDWYGSDYYKSSPSKDPTGPSSGSGRVIRGGSWGGHPQDCRAAFRYNYAPGDRDNFVGFRLARTN